VWDEKMDNKPLTRLIQKTIVLQNSLYESMNLSYEFIKASAFFLYSDPTMRDGMIAANSRAPQNP
jgi:hypothetical protein